MKKNIKIGILVLVIILVVVGIIILINKKNSGSKNESETAVTLQKINTKNFSINMPLNYKIETVGLNATFGIKLVDKDKGYNQLFIYSAIGPFNKSKEAAEIYKGKAEEVTDELKTAYELRATAPIFSEIKIEKLVEKYNEYVEYVKAHGTTHDYLIFKDATFKEIKGYETYLKEKATTEGMLVVSFVAADGQKLKAVIATSIDAKEENMIGFADIAEVNLRNIVGIVAPENEFEEVFPIFVKSLKSFKFSENYIAAAKETTTDSISIINNIGEIEKIMDKIEQTYNSKSEK